MGGIFWHIRGWKFDTFMGGYIHVYIWHIHWWKFGTLACTMNVPNLAHSWVEIWHMDLAHSWVEIKCGTNLAQSWVEIAGDKTPQSCVKEPNLNP